MGDIASDLARLLANRHAVVTAQAAARVKVQMEREQAPARMTTMTAFEALVRLTYGQAADVLADFGRAPHATPAPMSAEQKAIAVAKRAATRAVRQTMGPVQRKKVPKGNETPELVVTENAPAPPRGEAPAGNAPARRLAPAFS